ncbi:MAG: YtxH domain-containing protein, partial [Coriobacteriales bacterium]|nr:YtxH domain-containing protein [Coriobacteriales bacterium]
MSRLVSFVFGGAVGVALGLLFAPRPGEETRAYVAERVDEYWGRGQTFYTEGKSKVQQGINDLQPAFNQKTDEMREKIDNARAMIAEQVSQNAAAARD